ncbi:MAG: ABC transporter permease, partial [Leptolyngbyaceae cyanobacterium MAG.088]|nr:ABC transporter permease [Leptolyngbyaceae cyanobacterium MAG.088]
MADNVQKRRWTISQILMWFGIAITLVFILVAFFAPAMQSWGWIQDPLITLENPVHVPPSGEHWFGTSRQGYDVFARTLFGARAAWQVVLLATAMSVVVGVPLGMVSGYLGGKLDRGLLFFMDTIYTLPVLLLAVTLAVLYGHDLYPASAAAGSYPG